MSHSQQLDMLIKLVGLKNMKKVTENWKTVFYTEFKGTSTRYVNVPNLQLIKVQYAYKLQSPSQSSRTRARV